MLSALLMLGRVARALRYAVREEDFLPVAGAGTALIVTGTIAYALGAGWHVVDAPYFAVATLTTTSVADPDLVLHDRWLKTFTVLYLLVGIGILVEILRRLGFGFVAVRQQERDADAAQPGGPAPRHHS
jgi:Ion channel